MDFAPSEVEVEPTLPVSESSYAKNEEFFLFSTIVEASMIEKKLGDKPVYFEISIGNAGNAIDGHNEPSGIKTPLEDSQELGKSFFFKATPCTC